MKSRFLLFVLALVCAACARESRPETETASPRAVAPAKQRPASASPADVTVTETAAPQVAGIPAAQPVASTAVRGQQGRPHHTSASEPVAPAAAAEPRRITADELRPLLDRGEAVLVDVRGASDWAFYRAAEAIHIPYAELRARSAELPHEALIALYCT